MTASAPIKRQDDSGDARSRILAAAARLIAAGGRDAATTRAVATAAGVQAPTLYRFFGDKRGLLDAAAESALAAYVADKSGRAPHRDPVQALRDGWDTHVAFGLTHPGLYAIMNGDPHPERTSPADLAGLDVLRRRIGAIALAGRLRVSEARALGLVRSMCNGTVLTLLSQPEDERDEGLSEAAREALLVAITGEAAPAVISGTAGAAMSLRASLDTMPTLSAGERHLLEELLDRIADER